MVAPLAPVVFGLAALATGIAAVDSLQNAVERPGGHTALVAAYCVLRAAVAAAFATCTVGRLKPRRQAREPTAIAACVIAVGAVVAMSAPRPDTPQELSLAGELIAVGACVWLLASVVTLGRCFGVLPEARGLVMRGPYRHVRHPVYLGEIGASVGLVVASPALANVVLLACFALAQAVRMRLEERALTEAFPDYAAYATATPRLLPSVPLSRTMRRAKASHALAD